MSDNHDGGDGGKDAEADLAGAERLIALDPNDGDARRQKGDALMRLGRPNEAVGELGRAVELAPGDPETRWELGWALYASYRDSEALREFDAAVSLDSFRTSTLDPARFCAIWESTQARLPLLTGWWRLIQITAMSTATAALPDRAPAAALPPASAPRHGDPGHADQSAPRPERVGSFGKKARIADRAVRSHATPPAPPATGPPLSACPFPRPAYL